MKLNRKKKGPEKWYKDENIVRLTEAESKFIFDQSEKQLKETIDTGNLIVSRTSSLLTLTSGLLIGLIGYSINRWETKGHTWEVLLSLSVTVELYMLVATLLLCINLFGYTYRTTGSEPKPLLNDIFFSYPDKTREQRILHYYRNEFIQYQDRITANKRVNNHRWLIFKIAFLMIIAIPVVIFIAYRILTCGCHWRIHC